MYIYTIHVLHALFNKFRIRTYLHEITNIAYNIFTIHVLRTIHAMHLTAHFSTHENI